MTTIVDVLAVPAVGAGYCEDLAALQAAPIAVADRFTAAPVTPGFRAVREVAEAVAIGLVLDSGQVAWGDCVAVSYSGKAGREPVFRAKEGLETIEKMVAPVLRGCRPDRFRELAAEIDALTETVQVERALPPEPPETERPQAGAVSRRALLMAPLRAAQSVRGDEPRTEKVSVERRLHSAARYGLSQALLQAVALGNGISMAEVIAREWDLPVPDVAVPIHAQSGAERHHNAEKMIVRRIASLPHAMVDDVESQVGPAGSELTRYIRWLVERIQSLAGNDYAPTIHLDLHGALGQICENEAGRMLGQLLAWELAARPYPLRIESPMILESRQAQIEAMAELRQYVSFRNMKVRLVADEWANTLEDIYAFVEAQAADMIQIKMPDLGSVHNSIDAVLACKAGGVSAFLGGSYAETALSARVSVHAALATQPDLIMAKPGMGVDEAISLTHNEMQRTLACIAARSLTV